MLENKENMSLYTAEHTLANYVMDVSLLSECG